MRYILNKKKQKIAYNFIKGKSPGIIFLHGLNSDMMGKKAISIEKYAKKNKLSYLRFDCRGHGKSFGKFENFTLTDWKEDILYMIDNVAKGPQILIGSSMGGWLMTLAAKYRSKRIVGLVGLAAAVDFGNDLYNNLSLKNKKEIKNNGFTKYIDKDFSYILTNKFFLEAKKNNVLKKPLRFKKPVILIHGMRDNVVSQDTPKKLVNLFKSDNQSIYYLKSSDHSLSKSSDLIIINNVINSLREMI